MMMTWYGLVGLVTVLKSQVEVLALRHRIHVFLLSA